MLALVSSHDMEGFIYGSLRRPPRNNSINRKDQEWLRSDILVQGWIFGSLSEDVMRTVVDLYTAGDVWDKLQTEYEHVSNTTTDTIIDYRRNDKLELYTLLCRAIANGDFLKAKEISDKKNVKWTDEVDELGNTAFHVATRYLENTSFFKMLLLHTDPESLQHMVNRGNFNPLQEAVFSDNIPAVIMLVDKNPQLLFCCGPKNCPGDLPLLCAARHSQRNVFCYLFRACKQHIALVRSDVDWVINPFQGDTLFLLLNFLIVGGLFDVA